MDHHALSEQAGEGFRDAEVAGRGHGAGKEARIEQVQNGVLDAADILVDRQPGVGGGLVGRRVGMRCGEAGEIPGRVDKCVHGVGLARCRAAALGADHILPGRVAVERVAGLVEIDVLRQFDRQIGVGNRDDPQLGQ